MIRAAKKEDAIEIYNLAHSSNLDNSLFIKPKNIKEIEDKIDLSFVFEIDSKIVAFILIDYKRFNKSLQNVYVINSILSKEIGAADKILNHIPKRKYNCTIAPNNLKSQTLFKRHGFKKIDNITFMGYQREVYSNA